MLFSAACKAPHYANSSTSAAATTIEYLGKMHALAVGELADLLPATEPVGHNQCHRPGSMHRRHQAKIRNRLRHLNLVRLKPKRPGHPATSGVDHLHLRAGLAQQRNFALRPAKHRLVMAVAMHNNLRPLKPAIDPVRSLSAQPVRQQPDLFAHLLRTLIVGKKLKRLILEDARATRLKKNKRQSRFNLRSNAVEHLGHVAAP